MKSPIFKPAGFARLATIKKVDTQLMVAYVSFRDAVIGTDEDTNVPVQLPIPWLSSGGGFIGGYPAEGTPVYVSQVEGGGYTITGFAARDPNSRSSISQTKINIPDLTKGILSIQANSDGSITLDDDAITIGEPRNSVVFDITRKVMLNSFDYSYYLGQGSRLIDGLIRRDRRPKSNYPSFLREYDPSYDDTLKTIGMDPTADARSSNAGSAIRNPSRIEKHEIVYEFDEFSNVKSNDKELQFYKTNQFPSESNIIDRRAGRADSLSLSLIEPNYLIESIKGTVVDVYGNLVDINRNILPIGKDNTGKTNDITIGNVKSTANESDTFKNIYEQIKRIERKSLAFHFEINARKEVPGSGPPNINDRSDYARARSRFHLDIDKEGQIKMNVPASSENGNIPLLTRYENYSTVYPNPATNNPNDYILNDLYKDVLAEGFLNTQPIKLIDEHGNPASPIDRFSTKSNPIYIGHGSVYHDISKTISTLQTSSFYIPVEYQGSQTKATTGLAAGRVPAFPFIVNSEIVVSGPNANGGGRSGSFNFDGSLELNVGANTIDRQSIWLDTEGGIVFNIGRDLRNISIAANFDGQVLAQIGGNTVAPETGRFIGFNTGWIAGVLDIRVFNQNKDMNIVRIDNEGVSVTTPGRVVMYSAGDMMLRSGATMHLEGERILANGRSIVKDVGKGSIR